MRNHDIASVNVTNNVTNVKRAEINRFPNTERMENNKCQDSRSIADTISFINWGVKQNGNTHKMYNTCAMDFRSFI